MEPLTLTKKDQTEADKKKQELILSAGEIPKHIAIIMDGNGRWAKKQGKTRLFGHQEGASSVDEIVTTAAELGVEYLTLYAFSTENWNRPQKEVNGLMDLLISALKKYTKKLVENNVKLTTIGDIESLPQRTQNKLQNTISKTATNTGLTLVLALSYSSRWEITEMTKKIAQLCVNGELSPNNITQDVISSYMNTTNIPDPELLIRTSGEYRISNFLLWQIPYTELHFTEVLWPDFKRKHFYTALIDFQNRKRRFGKIEEQIK